MTEFARIVITNLLRTVCSTSKRLATITQSLGVQETIGGNQEKLQAQSQLKMAALKFVTRFPNVLESERTTQPIECMYHQPKQPFQIVRPFWTQISILGVCAKEHICSDIVVMELTRVTFNVDRVVDVETAHQRMVVGRRSYTQVSCCRTANIAL